MKAGSDRTKKFFSDKIYGRNHDDDIVWDKVKDVPKLGKAAAVFLCIINIILPGFGTITAACMTKEAKVPKTQVVVGLL